MQIKLFYTTYFLLEQAWPTAADTKHRFTRQTCLERALRCTARALRPSTRCACNFTGTPRPLKASSGWQQKYGASTYPYALHKELYNQTTE